MKLEELLKTTKTGGVIEIKTELGSINFCHDPHAINALIVSSFGEREVESFEIYPNYYSGLTWTGSPFYYCNISSTAGSINTGATGTFKNNNDVSGSISASNYVSGNLSYTSDIVNTANYSNWICPLPSSTSVNTTYCYYNWTVIMMAIKLKNKD